MKRAVLCTLSMLILVTFLSACGESEPPTATPEPTSEPCFVEANEFITEIEAMAERWDDAVELAGSTSRGNLSPMIADLQEIKRDANALEPQECASVLQDSLVQHMESTIDSFMLFLDPDYDELDFEMSLLVADIAQEAFSDNVARISVGGGSDKVDVTYVSLSFPSYTRNVSYKDATGQTIDEPKQQHPWIKRLTVDEGEAVRLDVNSPNPTADTACVILANGKVIAQERIYSGVDVSCNGVAR